ncbi:MAG TPA: hypothetical protein VK921_12430, partial [Anditalea sp.]|nr:hypothetical protein [Anditalea sp.]
DLQGSTESGNMDIFGLTNNCVPTGTCSSSAHATSRSRNNKPRKKFFNLSTIIIPPDNSY